jgi:hypothetical protein
MYEYGNSGAKLGGSDPMGRNNGKLVPPVKDC